jgi:arylsulfatase A-like enzyme
VAAKAEVTRISGSVVKVSVSDGGKDYTNGARVTFSQPESGFIGSITVNSGGSGYRTKPNVLLYGGGGTGATADAVWNQATGIVTGVTITNPGRDYVTAPNVYFYEANAATQTLKGAVAARATAFLEEHVRTGRPFYLQVAHYAVHLDIQHSAAALERVRALPPGKKHNLATFAAMTDDLDAGIGRLLNKITELGLRENTYIFFLSDNGGRMSLPGSKDLGHGLNYPLRGGKATLYEGGIRVPFIVLGPGVKAGSVSDVPATGLDFLPTMAELAGYQPALPATMDGGSLVPVLHHAGVGAVKRQRPYLVFHQAFDRTAQSALRWDNFKLVKTWKSGRLELFDLSQDLSEAHDLSAKMPEKTREMDQTLTAFLAQVKATTVQTKVGKDE